MRQKKIEVAFHLSLFFFAKNKKKGLHSVIYENGNTHTSKKYRKNPDTKNLNAVTELLLLSGGTPIWFKGNINGYSTYRGN